MAPLHPRDMQDRGDHGSTLLEGGDGAQARAFMPTVEVYLADSWNMAVHPLHPSTGNLNASGD